MRTHARTHVYRKLKGEPMRSLTRLLPFVFRPYAAVPGKPEVGDTDGHGQVRKNSRP